MTLCKDRHGRRPENQLTCPNTQTGRFGKYLLPCLQRPVGIAAVLDAQDDEFAEVKALGYMAQHFGFLEATEDRF
jgi:hypothetical protein